MNGKVDRRGFISGIFGSLASLRAWKPKKDLVLKVGFDRASAAGSIRRLAPRSLLPTGYPIYTLSDLVRDYNDVANVSCLYYAEGFQLVGSRDDQFASFSITTAEII